MNLVPETSPLMCLGCFKQYPPDPPNEENGQTRMGGICPECDGPLQMIQPQIPAAGPEAPPAVGPEAPEFGFGRFGPNTSD